MVTSLKTVLKNYIFNNFLKPNKVGADQISEKMEFHYIGSTQIMYTHVWVYII